MSFTNKLTFKGIASNPVSMSVALMFVYRILIYVLKLYISYVTNTSFFCISK